MKFFFDRNISIRLARMAAEFDPDYDIQHLDDDARFTKISTDVEIIHTLKAESPRPVFLTSDLNIKRKYPHERKALSESGLTAIFFRKTFHHLSHHAQVLKLFKVWPDILKATSLCKVPTVFEVTPNGKLIKVGPTADL
ncbi:MAG: hypothetical protein ISS69_10600 [Phycisphaerae bacterium]|nr:hypothetical protein [Phycisphaerae bacterium]